MQALFGLSSVYKGIDGLSKRARSDGEDIDWDYYTSGTNYGMLQKVTETEGSSVVNVIDYDYHTNGLLERVDTTYSGFGSSIQTGLSYSN